MITPNHRYQQFRDGWTGSLISSPIIEISDSGVDGITGIIPNHNHQRSKFAASRLRRLENPQRVKA